MSEAESASGYIAATLDEIAPGGVKRIVVGEKKIGLYNVDGTYYAIDDTCTHMKARLSNGYVSGQFVECPVHFGRFDITTGKAVGAPCTVDLATYPVSVVDGKIVIGV